MVVSFDSHILNVQTLAANETPQPDAQQVQWLVPGFINAHCHLEYSWLGAAGIPPLPRGQVPFGEWMQAIMAARPATAADIERQSAAMTDGAEALLRGGCTAVIDSTTDGASASHLARAGVPHSLFHEVLGLSRERAEPIWRRTMDELKSAAPAEAPACLIGHGVNPHAPYSVGPWLREKLRSNEATDFPQAWHLAETPDEEELFLQGTGSIAEFLKERGMPMPWCAQTVPEGAPTFPGSVRAPTRAFDLSDESSKQSPGVSPFQFLHQENQLNRCQVTFHGNTLSLREAAFFSGDRALVHCPATHRWFKRRPAPLRAWLDAGVNLCLGTDSLASSNTLSMLGIVQMALVDNPELSADDVLQMACTNAARIAFLRDAGYTGVLQPGSPADFVALETENPIMDWRGVLAETKTRVNCLWIKGRQRSRQSNG